jgi:hypothetical protein
MRDSSAIFLAVEGYQEFTERYTTADLGGPVSSMIALLQASA